MILYKLLQISLGLSIAAAGMWIFLKDVDGARLAAELHDQKILSLLGCALLAVTTIFFRAQRLRLILPDTSSSSKKQLFDSVIIEFSVNNIFPGRIGEVARALLLWKRNKFTPVVSIGSIIVERIFDLLTLLCFFFIPVYLTDLHEKRILLQIGNLNRDISLMHIAHGCLTVFLTISTTLMAFAAAPLPIQRALQKCVNLLPRKWRQPLVLVGLEIHATIRFIFSLKLACGVIAYSILIELAYAASFLLLIAPLNPSGVLGSMFAQAFGAFGAAIPLAPGYFGTVHAMLLQGFTLLGFEPEKARATAIVYHGVGFLTITTLGIFFLVRSKTGLVDLFKAKSAENIIDT